MSIYVSSESWLNPVSINYHSAANKAVSGGQVLMAVVGAVSQSHAGSMAAEKIALSSANSGAVEHSAVEAALAERGIGTNIDITA